ncbi:MAG: hypothetical protein AB7T10_07550 [bacterium]
MKKILIVMILLTSVNLSSMPIIFLNGNKAEGVDSIGWLTWNDTKKENPDDPVYYSSMHQVSGYHDYSLSPVLDCNKYTELPSEIWGTVLVNL